MLSVAPGPAPLSGLLRPAVRSRLRTWFAASTMAGWLQGALCRAVKKPHLPGRLTSTCSTHFWPAPRIFGLCCKNSTTTATISHGRRGRAGGGAERAGSGEKGARSARLYLFVPVVAPEPGARLLCKGNSALPKPGLEKPRWSQCNIGGRRRGVGLSSARRESTRRLATKDQLGRSAAYLAGDGLRPAGQR